MNERLNVTGEELERAVAAVRTLQHGEPLCALCYDVLSRQAEGKAMFAGKKYIAGRAKVHGVARDATQTPFGDLLIALERGPESSMQWALLAALFVRGFEQAVRAESAGSKALVASFAAHSDWLELSSPYRVFPLLDGLLMPELAAQVYAEVAALVLRDDDKDSEPETRARNAGRIAGLAEARSASARTALERIETSVQDGFSRTLAAFALGKTRVASDSVPPETHVRGRLQHPPRAPWLAFIGWLSGWALVVWALRLVFAAVGYFTEIEADFGGEAVRVRRTTFLLGRTMQRTEQVYPLLRLCAAQRAARFPTLHFVLGAFCLALGVVLGGVFAFDAARTGDRTLWLIAAALLLSGSGLDLALEVVIPGSRSRVTLDLDFGRPHRLCIGGVAIEEADGLLKQLWRRLSRIQGATSRALA